MMREKFEEDRMIRESELDEILNKKLTKLNIDAETIIGDEIRPKKIEHHVHKPLQHQPKSHEKLKLNLDSDYEILLNIFDDEFTADAVIKALKESPVEIQIIAKIVMDLHKKIDEIYGE